ncbi:saccharopine dehydrogenase (NADP+, L-glutamate forming) [Albidovulum inexpectatum]|uniref:Saccharopine dehydrogenase (NADP+, L-glutamate forming) n=1 Tax=Albidovulum inexpectatum TaxID=196587 RepID=A0A2S5JM61_9RHOB|nr:saccharopine dehydrogenase family protein [Albidovulum inexpectatum]PPB82584.1 saccharopine dehydrogenase (NADP+, L-glutamate forming) [Albidovulum inexpectatum]
MRIHWCGTGLSSRPGLRRLIEDGHPVTVWNLPVDPAREAVGDLTDDIHPMQPERFAAALKPGDIVVSMLPAALHEPLARQCVEQGAHFVCSSYMTDALRGLNAAALEKGLRIVCEVGLDPGIDHLMAHDLIAAYRAAPVYSRDNRLVFRSYCGGVPAIPNAFRYKFSWSPLGVLRALMAPARSIRAGVELSVAHPWDALRQVTLPLTPPESFEVYPNRDSLPYLDSYGLRGAGEIREFERGTLRLTGWAEAWAEILEELRANPSDARLQELAGQLWQLYPLGPDEPDRVVMQVELIAEAGGRPVWHRSWVLDARGDLRGSAMARLVSGTVALAVEAVAERALPAGVQGAPSDPRLYLRWLDRLGSQAQVMRRVDHLQGVR